jgi:hypothetical protein
VVVQNDKSSGGLGIFPNIQSNSPKQQRVMIRRKGMP